MLYLTQRFVNCPNRSPAHTAEFFSFFEDCQTLALPECTQRCRNPRLTIGAVVIGSLNLFATVGTLQIFDTCFFNLLTTLRTKMESRFKFETAMIAMFNPRPDWFVINRKARRPFIHRLTPPRMVYIVDGSILVGNHTSRKTGRSASPVENHTVGNEYHPLKNIDWIFRANQRF